MTDKELKRFLDFWYIDLSKLVGKKYRDKLKRMIDYGADTERYDRKEDEGDTLQQ